MPHLQTMSPEDRMEMPKMGDKSVSFVKKTLEHCRDNPGLVPQYLDVEELARDVEAVDVLREIYLPMLKMTEGLSDTITLAGSDAMTAPLMFYNFTKGAAKSNIPMAKVAYNELSARFPGRPKKTDQPGEA